MADFKKKFIEEMQEKINLIEVDLKRRMQEIEAEIQEERSKDGFFPSADILDQVDRRTAQDDRAWRKSQIILQLKEVEAAKKRLEDGSYGYCEVSGEPIEEKRLRFSPLARLCIDEMRKRERLQKIQRM